MDYATRTARALLGATAHPGGTALTGHLLDLLAVRSGEVALDVACGDGATLRLLSARGARPLGVDVEPRAVARARRRAPALVADAHDLPLPPSSVDVVVVECSLSTFARPERVLDEVGRVLRPGGRLGVTDVVLDRERAAPEVVRAVDALTTARPVAEYEDLLRGSGFTVSRVEDRADDARALVRRVRRRLAVVSPRWSRVAAACESAVRDGSLGYALLTATRPPVS